MKGLSGERGSGTREPPATHTGKYFSGRGSMVTSSNCQNRPWKETLSSVSRSFTASSTSSVRRPRSFIEIPIAVNSGSFHPGPTPKMNRPSDMWSRVASSLASSTGWRSGTTRMWVPIGMVSVAPATQLSTIRGSIHDPP